MGVHTTGSLRALFGRKWEASAGLEQMCLNINATITIMSLWWVWTEAPYDECWDPRADPREKPVLLQTPG